MLRSDDVSDAPADDQGVCPTMQPFIPNWTTPLTVSGSEASKIPTNQSPRSRQTPCLTQCFSQPRLSLRSG
jgi:hypothetical protein